MVDTAATNTGLTFRQVTKGGCPPVPAETMYPRDPSRSECPQFNAAVKRYVLQRPEVRYVVLAANWQGITEGAIRLGSAGSAMPLADPREAARSALKQLADELRRSGKSVLIIGQTPLPDRNVIQCMTRRRHLGLDDATCTKSSLDLAFERDLAARALFAGAIAHGAKALSPLARFCDRNSCSAVRGTNLLYIDGHHLSPVGAHLLEEDFEAVLTRARYTSRATTSRSDERQSGAR